MRKDFEDGRAFIPRLGRYGDAETKTVADSEGRLPRIKISGLSSNAVFGPKTTTVWLAAEQDTDKRGLLPFGWVLVEIDPVQENKELLNFCKAESEEKARKEDDEAARAAKEKAWAALTPEDRLEDFRQRLEGMNPLESNEVGAAILSEGQKFLEDALTWPEAERQKCAEIIAPLFKAKNMFSVGGSRRTQRFKELLEKLRGKNNG
jgi:CRISPR-associated protein Csm5